MNKEQKDFIEKVANACIKYKSYGILPSMTIAQAIKESGWGKSSLGAKYFNFFGMKWTKTCGCDYVELKTKEWDGSKYVEVKAKFRKYNSFEEGIEGYYKFITGYKRYSNLIGEKDSKTACIKIQQDGWATSPTYGTSLYNDYVIPYGLEKYDSYIPILEKNIEASEVVQVTPSTAREFEHTVVKGDTLWGISKKYLGNGVYWRKIYDYNNMSNTLIKVGQVIKIPKEG